MYFKFVKNICLGEGNSAMVSTRRVKTLRDFFFFPYEWGFHVTLQVCTGHTGPYNIKYSFYGPTAIYTDHRPGCPSYIQHRGIDIICARLIMYSASMDASWFLKFATTKATTDTWDSGPWRQ